MSFIHPEIVYIIPVMAVLFFIVFRIAAARRRKMLFFILGNRADEPGAVTLSAGARIFRECVAVLLMAVLLLVIARPHWGRKLTPEMAPGRDIMVLFDVSKSMLSDDVAPSRLEHGRFLLKELIAQAPEDRFGIVAFAGKSYVMCPLTANRTAINEYIDELDCDLVPVGGTDLAGALKNAFAAFRASEGTHRAVLLITDGDELTGSAANSIKELKKRGIPVFIAGLGEPAGVPVRDKDGKIVRTADGKPAMTRLNEKLLKNIAAESSGTYIRSTSTSTGAPELANAIMRLGRAEREGVKRSIPVDRFPGFVVAAFVLYLIYMLVSERSSRTAGKSRMLILFAALFSILRLGAAEDKAPAAAQQQLSAAELYNRAHDEQSRGADPSALYAEALHSASGNPRIQSKCYYNLATRSHANAQKDIASAENSIKLQQLPDAKKALNSALENLNAALPDYSAAFSADSNISSVLNTGNLIAHHLDLKKVKELQKKIEDLEKKQQQAKQNTGKAQQDNQSSGSRQQKSDSIERAKNSASSLKEAAKQMEQKQLEEKAEKAEKALEKAARANAEGKDNESRKHLKDAADALGVNEKKEQQNKEGNEKQPQGKPEGSDRPLPQMNKPEKSSGGKPEQDIDPKSAEQLLDMLKNDEKQRRKELMQRSRQRVIQVEKDW